MKRFIHFFSLALLTQVILMLSQLILLPIQIRNWGQSETALWYSALALATMTYFVDCGLRTAGHAELVKGNSNPSEFASEYLHFQQIWNWIRILILAVTVVLILSDLLVTRLSHLGGYRGWHAVLILACALETTLIIRITYLDSLGSYRGAEASYFCFALFRLALSIPALLIFHLRAPGLAAIYLFTAAIALLAQGYLLCRPIPLLQLSNKLLAPSWKVLALARHTVAEPIANWARLSLPVLVIGQISAPMAVTTYVALRAVFGAGRTTIQQLARVASVEVLKSRAQGQSRRAESLLTIFLMAAICFGAGVGFFVVIDNLRLLGLWLKHFDRTIFQRISLAFCLTAPFFSYQIPMNVMFRTGQLASVARRHYGFVAYSVSAAVLSLGVKSLPLYLGLLVSGEIFLSISFFSPKSAALRLAGGTSLGLYLVWLVAHNDLGGWFEDSAIWSIDMSILLFLAIMLTISLTLYFTHSSDILSLRRTGTGTPSAALAE